jgi:hypothetical protein
MISVVFSLSPKILLRIAPVSEYHLNVSSLPISSPEQTAQEAGLATGLTAVRM